MKIEGPRAPTAAAPSKRAGAAGATGFSVPAGETRAAAPASAAAPLTALDAVLALQVDGGGKRKRQVRRGAQSLDALDRLAAAMLSGGAAQAGDLDELRAALRDREPTGDTRLDSVLQEIDVRSAVELAKRERAAQSR